MGLNIFIYIVLNIVFLQVLSLERSWMLTSIELICIGGIATFGIAHGAIDHIIYKLKKGNRPIGYAQFIIQYVAIAALVTLVWFFFSNLAFALFLVISAYHFGQSQFVDYPHASKKFKGLLYLLWGSLVLSTLFYLNKEELVTGSNLPNSISMTMVWLAGSTLVISLISLVGFLTCLIYLRSTGSITIHQMALELVLLALMGVSFYLLPTFIAFSIFFVVIHSTKVLEQEYEYCKQKLNLLTKWSFIKLFLPLTAVSLVGVLLIYLSLSHLLDQATLFPLALLILLSSLTVPHAFVMERFYKKS